MRAGLRWGIVGFGWVARDYMGPAIAASGGCVTAVCDADPAARSAAAALGATVHAEVDGLLDQTLDAIYVATPNHLHRAAVEACVAAGVPVLCEKPLAATLPDAEAMVAAASGAGVLLGSAFDQRHHPAHRAIRDAVAAGRLGTVTAIRIVYGCWLGPNWTAGRPQANWRVEPTQAGGGALIDLAPHGLDLVDALLGEPIVALQGLLQRRVHAYPVDDGGLLIGQTASGVLISLHNSYNTPDALPRRRLEVVGTSGQIVATDTMGQTAGGSLVLVDAASGAVQPLDFDGRRCPFAAQAAAFADAVAGDSHDFDARRDLAGLRLLMGVLAGANGGALFGAAA